MDWLVETGRVMGKHRSCLDLPSLLVMVDIAVTGVEWLWSQVMTSGAHLEVAGGFFPP